MKRHYAKLVCLVIAAVCIVTKYLPQFSMFAASLSMAVIGLGLVLWIDYRFMPKYNTFDLDPKANPIDRLAGAIIFAALCGLVGITILASTFGFAPFHFEELSEPPLPEASPTRLDIRGNLRAGEQSRSGDGYGQSVLQGSTRIELLRELGKLDTGRLARYDASCSVRIEQSVRTANQLHDQRCTLGTLQTTTWRSDTLEATRRWAYRIYHRLAKRPGPHYRGEYK